MAWKMCSSDVSRSSPVFLKTEVLTLKTLRQSMKGRTLLHHDVRLDDRATLGSIPGIKNGTILRVDKHVSQVKNKKTRKRIVMSGPADPVVDEDVMDSIENFSDEEKISSEDERRMSSRRKRPSRTSAAAVGISIDNDSITNFQPGGMSSPSVMRDDLLNMTDRNPSTSVIALRTVKRETEDDSIAREQAIASQTQDLGHRLDSPEHNIAPHQETPAGNATASTYFPETTDAMPSYQSLMRDIDTTFLSGINAAAAADDETERPPTSPKSKPEDIVPARQCNTCGRACGCGGNPLTASNNMLRVPSKGRIQRQEATFTDGTTNGRSTGTRTSWHHRAESSWTGM